MDRQPPIGAGVLVSADEGRERYANKRGAKWGKGNNKKRSATVGRPSQLAQAQRTLVLYSLQPVFGEPQTSRGRTLI